MPEKKSVMPENVSATPDCLQRIPVLVDTADLSEEEWLSYRRHGIGGSDVAAIFGISPFRTAADIYYDKLNINPVWEKEENWIALKMGHLLEDLVAEIFHSKTDYPIFQLKKMFQHPAHPFMIADLDYLTILPDGSISILEIKTTSCYAKDNWWRDGVEIVPSYYESQGRHYMAVTNISKIFFCCLPLGTTDVIIRELHRDLVYEEEMIYLEQNFWMNHVQKQIPPPYTEDGDIILASAKRHTGPADTQAPVLTFDMVTSAKVQRYLELKKAKDSSEFYSKQLKKDMDRLKAMIIADMGTSCTALCQSGGISYTITTNPVRKSEINRDNLLRLKLQHPQLYQQFVTTSEYRRFNVKVLADDAA